MTTKALFAFESHATDLSSHRFNLEIVCRGGDQIAQLRRSCSRLASDLSYRSELVKHSLSSLVAGSGLAGIEEDISGAMLA